MASDEFRILKSADETGSPEVKKQIQELATQLADSRHTAMTAQHRLSELEQGRIFRSVVFWKKFFRNPLWGLKNIGTIPSLFIEIDVPPLSEKPESAKEILDNLGHPQLPTSLNSDIRTVVYPHIKVACIGNPGWLSYVAHTFDTSKVEWSELLRFGIDMFVVNEMQNSEDDRHILNLARKNEIPVVWFIDKIDPKIVTEHSLVNDILITRDKKRLTKNLYYLPYSVDITEFNPSNWSNQVSKESVHLKSDLSSFDEYKNLKDLGYVTCEADDFSSENDYVQIMLKLYASGIPVLTSGSEILRNIIDRRFHFFHGDSESIKEMKSKLKNRLFRERLSVELRMHVISNHSHINRFEALLELLKIPKRTQPKVSIISSTNRASNVDKLVEAISRQSYPNKELILILHGVESDLKKIRAACRKADLDLIIIRRPKDSIFGENLNLGLEATSGTFVTKMDDDDVYGPNHLWDLYWAWMYSGATVVGKWGNFVYLQNKDITLDFATKREEKFGRHLPGATIFMKRDDLVRVKFGRVRSAIDSEMFRRIEMRGGRLYSTHRFNFVRVRHGSHTYKQDDEDFIINSDGKPRKGLNLDECFI